MMPIMAISQKPKSNMVYP